MNNKTWLIIQREFNQRVRKRSFIWTTILTPLLFLGIIFVPVFLINAPNLSDKKERVGIIDPGGFLADSLQDTDRLAFVPLSAERADIDPALLQADKLAGILYIDENIASPAPEVFLYSLETFSVRNITDIRRQLNRLIEQKKLRDYNIENLQQILAEVKTNVRMDSVLLGNTQKSNSSELAMMLAYLFGILMYMLILLNGNAVMAGVIEEKNNRIVEVIISSVKPIELMTGKIIGIGAVALFQFLIWIIVSIGMSAIAFQFLLGGITPAELNQAGTAAGIDPSLNNLINAVSDPGYIASLVVCFFLFFIGGYIFYAAMYAALGSAVDNMQDAQQLTMPILIPLILSIVLISTIVTDHNGPVAFWSSMIPFTSPTVMIARIPFGVPFWQIMLSLLLLYGSFMVTAWGAAKIYRTGIFMYGKKHSWKEIVKWMRYK